MPAGYTVDRGHSVVFVRLWGTVREDDLSWLADHLRRRADVGDDWASLTDARHVEGTEVSGPYLRNGYRSPFVPSARRCILVSTAAVAGLSNMYRLANLDESAVTVAWDVAEGMEAVGLPADTELPAAMDASTE